MRDLRPAGGHADALDLPFQRDAADRVHAAAHLLAQAFEVGGGGAAGVEQEVAVLLADLRAAARAGRGSRRRRSAPRPSGPGGLRKVLPPVRARTGCVASRLARISAMRAAMAAGSPGRARKRARTTTAPGGSAAWR